MNKLKNLAVVGSGSAGLVAALIIKTRFPHLTVDIVRSKKIGIIGVGEGSTEHWTAFMDFVGIHYFDLIKECDSTFKSGIMFKGWGEQDYLQSISSGFNQTEKKFPYAYAHQISKNVDPKDLLSTHAWDSRVNTWFLGNHESCPVLQFHFNTNKLNEFLTSVAEHKGINFYDDEISDVTLSESGEIESLIGENKTYKYDFYIDSTGFKRILIDKLGAKWQSYSNNLKMKSAIMFQTEMNEGNIPMWTTAQAMDYGWMFSIPTYGRTGNGYIFDSDYIDKDQAQAEIENFLGKSVEIGKEINFIPGALDTPWIKNCCAVGLSASFVEPLEASSIGTSIQQSFILSDLLVNYDENVISKYNKTMQGILDNIRDFIILHYLTKKTNTKFWIDARNTCLPESLQTKLEIWKNKLPTAEDFADVSSFKLFSEYHYILVLYGLGLLDSSKVQEEYTYMTNHDTKLRAAEIVDLTLNMRCQTISHKTMIELIRDIKNENYL
jgi:tryptophan halogenase